RAALRPAGTGPVPAGQTLEVVDRLMRRSLIERGQQPGSFTLQAVVLEYASEQLVLALAREIEGGQPELLRWHAIVLATTKADARQSQERLLGQPLLQRLMTASGAGGAETRLLSLLEGWRGRPPAEQGYGPGNVVNLLRLLRGDLRGMDLARLSIRQAYL